MLLNALKVMTLTPGIRAFLAANDPMALRQAEHAIAAAEAAQADLAAFIDKFSHQGWDGPEGRIGYTEKLSKLQQAAGIEPEKMVATRTIHGVEYRMFRKGRDYRMTGGATDHTLTDSSEERAKAHWNGYSLGQRPPHAQGVR